jgi:hypothetical protein
MTTLQDNAVEPASPSELISTSRVLLLAPGEPRAPIAILSLAKRNAVVACSMRVGSTREMELGMGEAKWCEAFRPVIEKYKDGLFEPTR